jgi:hypothetical protein
MTKKTTLQVKLTYSDVTRVLVTGQLLRFIPPQLAAQYYKRESLVIT